MEEGGGAAQPLALRVGGPEDETVFQAVVFQRTAVLVPKTELEAGFPL